MNPILETLAMSQDYTLDRTALSLCPQNFDLSDYTPMISQKAQTASLQAYNILGHTTRHKYQKKPPDEGINWNLNSGANQSKTGNRCE